jgi:hypothetical protein
MKARLRRRGSDRGLGLDPESSPPVEGQAPFHQPLRPRCVRCESVVLIVKNQPAAARRIAGIQLGRPMV